MKECFDDYLIPYEMSKQILALEKGRSLTGKLYSISKEDADLLNYMNRCTELRWGQ